MSKFELTMTNLENFANLNLREGDVSHDISKFIIHVRLMKIVAAIATAISFRSKKKAGQCNLPPHYFLFSFHHQKIYKK